MSLVEIFSIILIHFIADFWLQTEQQGLNKSKNISYLVNHTYIYSLCWFIVGAIYAMINSETYIEWTVTLFVLTTFICHTATDYITSRITAKRYKSNHFYGINGFWFWISVDQFLHFLQLFSTYYLLTKI